MHHILVSGYICDVFFINARAFDPSLSHIGARVVIFLDQGRQNLEQHRTEHPDVVTSDLPDRPTLEKAASVNKYEIGEFVDEHSLYLAVLQSQG
jgi:hypothetical protein